MDPMASIKQTFFVECEEQLAELETGLLAIDGGDEDSETINAVFRAVHSIKGGAGAFGLDELVRFAHVFETDLDHVRSGRMQASGDVVQLMLRAADMLADLVCAARDGGEVDQEKCNSLTEELQNLAGPTEEQGVDQEFDLDFDFQPIQIDIPDLPEAPVATGRWLIYFEPTDGLYRKANEPLLLFRELARLGEIHVELHSDKLPALSDLEPEASYLSWTIRLDGDATEEAIQSVFEFVEWDCELRIEREGGAQAFSEPTVPVPDSSPSEVVSIDQALDHIPEGVTLQDAAQPVTDAQAMPSASQAAPKAAAAPVTIRVDLDRVDRLINLLGELVINQAMLSQRVVEAGLTRSSGVSMCLDELEQLTREIQDGVMSIRAQPVKTVFQRMTRVAREAALISGKKAHLVFDGETTEVDKTVIERLADPLTHMLRNAIDHGLEKPETRVSLGKPEVGTIKLLASHRSGRVVIEISDDGAGINRPRVKAIAVEKGLIPPDAALSDEEIDNLIFMPGFSTAAIVSDISGRGVGMDVVRQSVLALGGRISIASRPGQGSTFSLSLPLTLAVLDGMVIGVGGQTLVIPLSTIVETLQPKPGSIHQLGQSARVINIRDHYVPVVDTGQVLGYPSDPAALGGGVAILVESDDGSKAVLLADSIHGQRQVVIKSLETNYQQVRGIAAATILGDGRVALILDVDVLVSMARIEEASRSQGLALAG